MSSPTAPAPTSPWSSKFKVFLILGMGFFGDGWMNATIGLVVPMLGYLYWGDANDKIPTIKGDVIKASFGMGMIVGQVFFGVFADALGRHFVYGKELMLTIAGAFLVIMMPWGQGFGHSSVVAWMCVFRVLTGIGVGGDYPMSSTLSLENRLFKSPARTVLGVFSLGGVGYLTMGIWYLILLAAFKHGIQEDIQKLQYVWRLLFGIGLIPLCLTLYFRLIMPESPAFVKYVTTDAKQQRGMRAQWADFREYFSNWKHLRTLMATSLIWFLFDIAFYGVGLNQSIVLSQIGYAGGNTPYEKLWKTAEGNLIVGVAGYVPGYIVGIFLPDLIGCKLQQILGSFIVTLLYAVWAGVSGKASAGGLVTIFTFTQFFLNAGLASTTFLIPVQVFPTCVRSTAHGISAACGKLGAILTALVFGIMTDSIGIQGVMGFLTGLMFLCGVLTFLIPETKGKSLDDIEQDLLYNGLAGPRLVDNSDSSTTEQVTVAFPGKIAAEKV